MIEIRDIVKSYDDKEILHGISFDIRKGRVHAFLGRNGAGKTTFIRGFMDIFKFDSGTISIEGQAFDPKDYRIGYLPEERGMYQKVPILDQLLYFSKLKGISEEEAEESIMYLLEKLDLSYAAKDKLETLSKGNQQKVQLIQALMNKPEIIILDEPFSGLDPVNSQILKDLIFEIMDEDMYMIFSSHQMSHVEDICEDLSLIDHGDIVLSGNIDEIKKDMGQGKVFLKSSPETYKTLESSGYKLVESDEGVIIELGEKSKEDLNKELISGDHDIVLFGDYLPSLNEIYIETVGD